MRVILRLESGVGGQRRIAIREQQTIEFGSTDWAQFRIDDPALGEVQFRVECCATGCRLLNLDHSGPLRVNGKIVSEKTLVDGDIIRVGDSRLGVVLVDDRSIQRIGLRLIGQEDDSSESETTDGGPSFETRISNHANGLVEITGSGELHAASVARTIGAVFTTHVLVDVSPATDQLLSQDVETLDDDSQKLRAAITESPTIATQRDTERRILGPSVCDLRMVVLEDRWVDGAFALFSSCETKYVLAGLRRGELLTSAPALELPMALSSLDSDQLANEFANLMAILTPNQSRGGWSLLTNRAMVAEETLERFGLAKAS